MQYKKSQKNKKQIRISKINKKEYLFGGKPPKPESINSQLLLDDTMIHLTNANKCLESVVELSSNFQGGWAIRDDIQKKEIVNGYIEEVNALIRIHNQISINEITPISPGSDVGPTFFLQTCELLQHNLHILIRELNQLSLELTDLISRLSQLEIRYNNRFVLRTRYVSNYLYSSSSMTD